MGAAAAESGTFENLGPQVSARTIQGSVFFRDKAGKDLVYAAERGEPGHLLAYEVATGQSVLDLPMIGNDGAWEIDVSSDGWVYTAGGHGHMFRHRPGTASVEDLGQATPGQTVVWDVTPGADGEVFVGTYPGCRVVRYRDKEGFSDVGRGPLVEGENYVRCVAYHAASGKIYAGVGSHAHLIELDAKTGEKRELLAEKTSGQQAVYSLGVVPDEKSGDRLLAWVTDRNLTLVYNLRTRQLEREIPTQSVKAVVRAPDNEKVYFSDGERLKCFDLDKPNDPPQDLARCVGANAMRWLDADHLCVMTRYGLVDYDAKSGTVQGRSLEIPPQPIPIQSIELGPDGKMWMGGFLAGGTTAFDPATGKSEEHRGMSQIERIGVLGDELYLGVYPHARLYRFDPAKAWDADNPHKIGQIEGQSRPIAMLGVPALQKVFVGTVPEYGTLGGHLMMYDPKSDGLQDYGQAVANQSVVSLAYADGLVIGGSAICGGLGMKPSEKEAKVFGWDATAGKKSFELVPVPGAGAITCLINGPGKNVWGVADATLFILDPAGQKVVSTHAALERAV